MHKRGRLHRNVDALSRMEICPAKYRSDLASSLYELNTTSESEGLTTSDDVEGSEDSMEDLSEAERLQFLEARDMSINAECQRLALLETEEEPESLMAGKVLYLGQDESGENEYPVPEDEWIEAAELREGEDEEESRDEPDCVRQLRYDLEYDRDHCLDSTGEGAEQDKISDQTRQDGLPERDEMVRQDGQVALTEDEVLVEFLRTLTDEEVHTFLAKQAEYSSSESETVHTTAPERLKVVERRREVENVAEGDNQVEERFYGVGGARDCARCHGKQMEVERCMVCSTLECCNCLREGRGWSARTLNQNAWVCSLCAGKEYSI